MLNEPNEDQIPEEFPRERNNIDDFIKRRPSLRRSITGGGSGSTFRAACAAVDSSLPPSGKKHKITELCLNHTLMEMKFNALEKEQDAVAAYSERLRDNIEDILNKVLISTGEAHQKFETQTRTAIKQMKNEKLLWNEEYKKRREAYLDAKSKLKDALKGKVQIETGRLKSEDVKFLKSLPDFAAVNKKIVSYQTRHYIGLVHLEKNSQQLHRSLSTVEHQLDEVQRMIVPTFQWT
ncbi:hypothetical protein DAPPUDRAFT_112111 [Daphnia pulex]|uniref:Uncharacterized protein n=1 Tax=Daphnia pulex TaxID=6669 RepID=E9HB02_DAPPU|nr:hypothetical protein DAPPUDRAFT_112111 [Daphnia pulex]|eukprot:EFX71120.1 hypothetical protein DAPPUDRAFT_112111 [Daphnia pulex]